MLLRIQLLEIRNTGSELPVQPVVMLSGFTISLPFIYIDCSNGTADTGNARKRKWTLLPGFWLPIGAGIIANHAERAFAVVQLLADCKAHPTLV